MSYMKKFIITSILLIMIGCGVACQGGEEKTSVTPLSATLVSIEVAPANLTVTVGSTQQFTATGKYSDNSSQDLTSSVTWNSSDTGVATLTTSGLATAVSAGTATITATLGDISGNTTITVTPGSGTNPTATLVSITVAPANPTITVGSTQQFTATGTYSDNSSQDLTSSVTWSSSNTGVATLTTSGLATAVSAGTTTITATLVSISGTTSMTVPIPNPLLTNTTISWDAPTTNSDGSPLTPPLAGYKVYYAQKIGSGSIVFGNVTTIPDVNVTSASFTNHIGTYCYAITAYNTALDESDYSNIVSKTVNNGTISYGTCQ